ncbi:hypothetical protein HHK36_023370 [Tetracentron sinense]|uniref:Transcription factor CBF/NF-Y/archaeal histone domain-containing protein n=1 Tax=Tetracentron sinense TaxID=13715 RepID=A0A834YN35_TETSI|nr:hypothetical protein HHK36_023370 [Tetracentron sinense]
MAESGTPGTHKSMHSRKKGKGARSSRGRKAEKFLPIANISKIMEKGVPSDAEIANDAKESVQKCVSQFIRFITSEAIGKCRRERRMTINGDDVLRAMATLGFKDYIKPLKLHLQTFREGDSRSRAAGQAGRKDGVSVYGESDFCFNDVKYSGRLRCCMRLDEDGCYYALEKFFKVLLECNGYAYSECFLANVLFCGMGSFDSGKLVVDKEPNVTELIGSLLVNELTF